MSRELKSLRIKMGFTQKVIAKKLEMSESSYNKRENGLIPFSLDEIKKLKIILKLDNEDIIRIFFAEEVA